MHEPAVVLTDLALAILGAVLWWRLAGPGAAIMGGLASAAFWGAIFHAFFPEQTATPLGFGAWLAVAFSILIVAAALLDLSLSVFMARLTPGGSPGNMKLRRAIVALYCMLFAAVVLFIDESFSAIVLLCGPTLVLGLAAAAFEAIRTRSSGWALVALGLTVSAAAALLQQTRVMLHPVYFDHNAVYHVVQGAAVVLLYLGFHERPPRTDPAARAG
jgi:hypothetical protein